VGTTRVWVAAASMVVVGGMIVALGVPAGAAPGKKRMTAVLNGLQEDPSVSTSGRGSFEAVIDDEAQEIHYVLTYRDLESSPTLFAHIHFGSHDHNGGVAVFFCGGGTQPQPCLPFEDRLTGTIRPADIVGPNAQGIEPGAFEELVAAMRAGHTYVNVHTMRWPGGEIRGQINDADQRESRK
jgi:hypothetical protein